MIAPPAASSLQLSPGYVPMPSHVTVHLPCSFVSCVQMSVTGARNNVLRMTWITVSIAQKLAVIAPRLVAIWLANQKNINCISILILFSKEIDLVKIIPKTAPIITLALVVAMLFLFVGRAMAGETIIIGGMIGNGTI